MGEGGDLNRAPDRKAPAVQFDPLDLVERLGRHVALAAMRAVNDRNLFDQQKIFPLAIRPRDLSNSCSFFTAVIAYHIFTFA